jgi:methionyl aminopeptidase
VKFQDDGRIKIQEGMVLCLEPMVTVGDWRIKKSEDGHGWKTKDNSLSAHFEHTITVTKNGCQILTERE